MLNTLGIQPVVDGNSIVFFKLMPGYYGSGCQVDDNDKREDAALFDITFERQGLQQKRAQTCLHGSLLGWQ